MSARRVLAAEECEGLSEGPMLTNERMPSERGEAAGRAVVSYSTHFSKWEEK